jgi:hypothetical protein
MSYYLLMKAMIVDFGMFESEILDNYLSPKLA